MTRTSSVLETLFPGVSSERFLQEYWLGDRHLVAHGDRERLAQLFDPTVFDDLGQVLARHGGEVTGSLRDRHGQQCDLHSFSRDEAEALYDCGATLHLDRFESGLPDLRATSRALAGELGLAPELLRCTAFAATVPGPGSPLHCDDKDIFVIQLEGVKRWHIGPNRELDTPTTNVWPWARTGPTALRDISPPLETIELEPGSVLFVPRSHWHQTEVLTEGCFAITTGFWRPTWLHLLEVSLHNHLGADPTWRAPIGSAWGTAAQRAGVIEQYAARLRALAHELERLDAARLLELADPKGRGFPLVRSARAQLTIAPLGDGAEGWMVTVERNDVAQPLEVADARVLELVRWVDARTAPFELADAYAAFATMDRGAILALLRQLTQAGFLDRVQPLNIPLDVRIPR